MIIDVRHKCSDFDSYRAARVKSLFNAESGCNWEKTVELPIEGMDWKIGLIVGASGTGKTSIGSRIFPEPLYDPYAGWDRDKPIVDCIDPDGDFNKVTGMLSAVGTFTNCIFCRQWSGHWSARCRTFRGALFAGSRNRHNMLPMTGRYRAPGSGM